MCEPKFEQEQKLEQELTPQGYELPSTVLLDKNDFHVENQRTVFTRSIFESGEWKNCDAKIPIVLGEDKNSKPVILDLAIAPHILMVGATGSGKSVCINTIIMSLLFRFRPDELKFILFDPKVVEFGMYEKLPHLLTPVINDSGKFPFALRWAVGELNHRYNVMRDAGVKNLWDFNAHSHENKSQECMSVIVIIIDELSDLMASDARRDVEELIAYIAQRGRAAGIHIIISTSAPRKSVLTCIIKANFPTQICFRVSSQQDSRAVLDHDGAEKLQGSGDMLCHTPACMDMEHIQGAWIRDKDIEHVVHFVSDQAAPQYNSQIVYGPNEEYVSAFSPEETWNRPEYASILKKYLHPDDPPLARAALALVLTEGRISPSFLQRHLKTGYNQASSLIELFEERGIIRLSPDGGPKYELLISADCDNKGE